MLTQAIQLAEPCDDIDLWDSAATRYGIRRESLPENALKSIYDAYDSLDKNLEKHPGKLPELNSGLLDNLVLAALQAQKVAGDTDLQPAHWRKAINSVLTHCTRRNPGVRDFMKVICERLLPDENHKDWVDRERLADILNAATHIDMSFVRKHFWSLARAFGPGAFKGLQFRLDHPTPIGRDSHECKSVSWQLCWSGMDPTVSATVWLRHCSLNRH